MSNIKTQIQKDFIAAVKAKDENSKMALSGIKAKITEAEKSAKKELDDPGVIKVLASAIKQREQSMDAYKKAGRNDLFEKEENEKIIFQKYMPAQMSEQDIEASLNEIIASISDSAPNPQALIGRSIGEFNKKHLGSADVKTVKMIAERIVNNL